MKVGLEKLESHEGIAVKALLDSGATDLFIDTAFAKEKRFRMERMKKPLLVKNMDGLVNIGGAIMHQVECNMFFKGHIERVRMDVCNLGKTEVILGMPWLAAHNPEIDWEKGEVKMTRCPPICGKRKPKEKRREVKKVEKDEDEETLRKLVPKRFWKKRVRKNASAKSLGPCDRVKRRIYTEERKGVFIIQREKGGSASIRGRSTAKRVHSTLQITTNVTSTLCGKKGQ